MRLPEICSWRPIVTLTDALQVAEVAGAWGFGHLGRFAGYYADTFGELPSETLRRRRH